MSTKYVYAFGGGTAEGAASQKPLLGGKGSGLAEMARLGVPVPPGFTITTEACIHYQRHDGAYPDGLRDQVAAALARVEELQRRRFGDPADPLLVSVRSGAAVSMPGMMDTVLNLGLSRDLVEQRTAAGQDARFLWDAYRRLLTMYGDVVLGVAHREFETLLEAARDAEGVATDPELSAAALARVAEEYEALIERQTGAPFPQDPQEQLWGGINAVFDSWNNQRARDYRRLNHLPDDMGTAVNVQTMVFGNRGPRCATGVAFTRNPATGDADIYGEYLVNAQGEDVVAGIRTPKSIHPETDGGAGGMGEDFPNAFEELQDVARTLEAHFRDMQDLEFTVEDDTLYMLQTRTGKRTGPAAIRIAVDMVREKLIEESEGLARVEPRHLVQMLAPEFDLDARHKAEQDGRVLAKGLPAGPGAASGRIALDADRASAMAHEDGAGPVLLVREETSPEDIVGMHASVGILTSRGGMTSHAAVVARGLGKPCIVGAADLSVDEGQGTVTVGGRSFREGDALSIDGTSGEVIAGELPTRESQVLRHLLEGAEATPGAAAFVEVLGWADRARRLRVRANADTPDDARAARALGAQGIGLCRTEHMFFAEDRIMLVRRMILAADAAERESALERLLPMQQSDFEGIFEAMEGFPVTVRLLDPPLHEFLPHGGKALEDVARDMGLPPDRVAAKAAALGEVNPMLGHRGCRLGLTAPEIYRMQVEAIVRAGCVRQKAGDRVLAEIMIPLVGTEEELRDLRRLAEETAERVQSEQGITLDHLLIGTMIEVPRAALVADKIARHADFFSFGTNDLTQMTYGYSRDDAGRFLPAYVDQKILPFDPFARIDPDGVGQLVRMAVEKGRATKGDLHLGICGEHGGDPDSIAFCDAAGLDYVSCSPYRVPVARLAAARSTLGAGAGGED